METATQLQNHCITNYHNLEGSSGGHQSDKLLKVGAARLGCLGLCPVKVYNISKAEDSKTSGHPASVFDHLRGEQFFSYDLVRIPHVAMFVQPLLILPLGTSGRAWINLPHTLPSGNSRQHQVVPEASLLQAEQTQQPQPALEYPVFQPLTGLVVLYRTQSMF